MAGQAEQNILYTEATYTAGTIFQHAAIPIDEQIDALRRGITQGRRDHGVDLGIIMDFVRQDLPEDSVTIAEHAVDAHGKGVVALGLSGIEGVGPAEDHRAAFNYAMAHGLPIVPHAGETQGADSIWEALELTECKRIGHGIRCLEDDALVNELIEQQVVLEVCPSSNVCLNVVPSWEEHPLAKLRDRGLRVTLNSDDPPMFTVMIRRCSTPRCPRSTTALRKRGAGTKMCSSPLCSTPPRPPCKPTTHAPLCSPDWFRLFPLFRAAPALPQGALGPLFAEFRSAALQRQVNLTDVPTFVPQHVAEVERGVIIGDSGRIRF